jgi:CCR4-NOT transcription complex subunit 7/8
MSPGSEAWAGKARVVEVWAHNEDTELARICGLFREFTIAVMATSHDAPSRPALPLSPRTLSLQADVDGVYHVMDWVPFLRPLDYRCECLHAEVRAARFWNMSLALVNRDGHLAMGRVWRFHLGTLDVEDDRFLMEMGVEPSVRRADRSRLARALMDCCAILSTDVTWVTSDGAEDVLHLLDCLCPDLACMSTDRETLIRNSRAFFPELYDLRFLAKWRTLSGEEPPLLSAAKSGSPDALLRGFLALMREPDFADRMVGYNGMLSGLGHWDTPDLDRCKLSLEQQETQFKEQMTAIHGHDYDIQHMHVL